MLTLAIGKASARFEYRDEDGDGTTVTLSPSDDQETLVRKMEKVLDLVSPGPTGILKSGSPMAFHPAAGPNALRKDLPPASKPPVQPTNGWKAMIEPPEVPERLKGEVELIGEDEAP